MLSARKATDVVSVFRDVRSYRATAATCGVDPKTVKRMVAAREAGELEEGVVRGRRVVARNTGVVRGLVVKRVVDTKFTAKRLLAGARAAGYVGLIGNSGGWWRPRSSGGEARNGRQRRPAVWVPGETTLVFDWGTIGGTGIKVFCAVGVVAVSVRPFRPG